MSSGKTHDKIGVLCGAIFTTIGLFVLPFVFVVIFALSYLFGILWFSPDLDCKSLPWKRWGPFRVLWIPYQKVIGHRSPLSHSLLLGTVGRVLYVSIFVTLLWWLLFDFIYYREVLESFYYPLTENIPFIIFIGLELSALVHLLGDSFSFKT